MKDKKGFTLVELLAVIVILGIILLISVPKITNVIYVTRENADVSSAQMIVDSAKNYVLRNDVTTGEVVSCNNLDIQIDTPNFLDDGMEWDISDLSQCSVRYGLDSTVELVTYGAIQEKPYLLTVESVNPEIRNAYPSNDRYVCNQSGNLIDMDNGVILIPNSLSDFTISGTKIIDYVGTSTDVIIPCSMTEIGMDSFYNKSLTSVIIPDSIEFIGTNGFYYNNIAEVIIPNGITELRPYVFAYNKLTNVIVPTSVSTIGDCAFDSNKLVSVTLPDNLRSLGDMVFYNNDITSITIPSGLHEIGRWTFYGNNMTSVTIPENIEAIDRYAFRGNPITSLTIEGDPSRFSTGELAIAELYVKTSNSEYEYFVHNNEVGIIEYLGSIKTVTIPQTIDGKTVTALGDYSFDSEGLTSITIPNTVTHIGNYAIRYNSLTNITIPSSVTSISREAFRSNSLTNITIPTNVSNIELDAFAYNTLTGVTIEGDFSRFNYRDIIYAEAYALLQTTDYKYIIMNDEAIIYEYIGTSTDVTIPSSLGGKPVTYIGPEAFYDKGITSIVIPNTVERIGAFAFDSNKLVSVVVPEGVTCIEEYAFNGNNLTSVSLPDSLVTIEYSAFSWNSLTNINFLPENVTEIAPYAFIRNSFTTLTIPSTVDTIDEYAFAYNDITSVNTNGATYDKESFDIDVPVN